MLNEAIITLIGKRKVLDGGGVVVELVEVEVVSFGEGGDHGFLACL